MASVLFVRRTTRSGERRYLVRYRLGGRESGLVHGGSFTLERDAKARRDAIWASIAKGEVPDLDLIGIIERSQTVDEALAAYLATRIDASEATKRVYRHAGRSFGPLGQKATDKVTVADVQDWVTQMHQEKKRSPATIRKYLDALRAALDHAERDPNPARSARLRVPRQTREEIDPPPYAHFMALVEAIAPRFNLHVRVMEASGLRVDELLSLTWADVDVPGSALRVARNRTKGGTAGRRMGRVWPELMDEIADLLPLEDRIQSQVVFTGSDSAIRNAMARACKFAQIPHYSPHQLRHRWISLRMMANWPPHLVAREAGHSKTSVTFDVYSHVLLDEPAWLIERIAGDASVMPGRTTAGV